MSRRNRKGEGANRKPSPKRLSEPAIEKTEAANTGKKEVGRTPEYTELVLLVHAANLAEGELIKIELEAHGIPAMLEGEGAGVAGLPDVGAGVPVLVPEEFADQAAELIAELESAKPEGHALDEKENLFEEDEEAEDLQEVDELDELKDEDLDDDEDEDLDEEDDDLDEDDDEEEDEDLEEEEEDDEDWDEEEEEEDDL
jgi:hypothetical protein